jgi:hypothetical protein
LYRLITLPEAEAQICALRSEALGPFAELITLLEISPWSGRPFVRSKPRANMLTLAFGDHGFAVYIVLEEQREVYLIRVVWL